MNLRATHTLRRWRSVVRIAATVVLLLGVGVSHAEGAVTFVKTIGTAGNKTAGTSISITVPAAGVAAGNRVVVSFAMDPSAGAVSAVDSAGNTYAVDVEQTHGSSADGVRLVILSAHVSTALTSGNSITVTHPSAIAKAMGAFEFSGLANIPLDQTSSDLGTSAVASSGSTAATSVNNELLFGAVGVETWDTETFTPAVGWTVLPRASSGNTNGAASNITLEPEYQVVALQGTYSAGGVLERPDRDWATAIATYRASGCGDGVLDPGEGCDDGNQRDGDCCSALCVIEAPGTLCRASAGICDVAETCDGVNPTCPADGFASAATICRVSGGECDPAETCTGSQAGCPADARSTAVCRPAAGACDVAESCDGVGFDCPVDMLRPATHQCRGVMGPCDLAELCTGASATCPEDAFQAAGVECRAAADDCDVAEACDGTSPGCPSDGFQPDGTACDDVDACTIDDTCSAGQCEGTYTPTECVDNLVCYAASAGDFTTVTGANLADEIEDMDFDIKKPKAICSATVLGGGIPLDAVTSLVGCRIKAVKGEPKHVKLRNLQVSSALGSVQVDTIKPDTILIPGTFDSVVPPVMAAAEAGVPPRDAYKCYKVRVSKGTPKPAKVQVPVADQFTTGKILQVGKPKHLCMPVSMNSQTVHNTDAALLCHKAKPARGEPRHAPYKDLSVSTDTGMVTLSTKRESEVCVPALVVPPAP